MYKQFFIYLALSCINWSQAQQQWFTTYTDANALLQEANTLSNQFKKEVAQYKSTPEFTTTTLLNTTPYLIYYDGEKNTVNIPLWSEVLPELKAFTTAVTGSEAEGERMFGLFFNGFYLIHEYGHAFQYTYDKANSELGYANEKLANQIAFLYWKKIGKQKELDECYALAKKMFAQLKNPVPEGKTTESYFTENYIMATQDPFVYAYMQFGQFIEIYEDSQLPEFDSFMKEKFTN